jgi:hypothetical protein
MTRTVRLLVRLVSLTFSVCVAPMPAAPAAPPAPERQQIGVATNALPEVRIRRLHVARPDLILYPIAYEVIC